MVVTMLEAEVDPAREADLVKAYRDTVGDDLPARLIETLLLHEAGSTIWRIVTVWRSRAELDEYRASGVTPAGVVIFRAAGAEPALKIFEVAERVVR